jgi:HB1, ASXL, restriction endonuclease HTH domain
VPRMPRPGSAMHAVILVLDGKRKPMSTAEIWAEVVERGLATNLKGKTPDQTLAAAVAVHAKKGLYVERTAPGKFRLKKGVDAKALAATPPPASTTAPAVGTASEQPAATSESETAAA